MAQKYLVFFVSALMLLAWVLGQNVFAQDIPQGQTGQKTRVPGGQVEEQPRRQLGADLFGRRGGRVHPFLFMEAKYTDNLYYTSRNEESDFITSIGPGIWLAIPANREKLLEINTSPTSPGGLQVSRMKPRSTRRMQTYFMYSPSVNYYRDNSEHDHIAHRAEAMFQNNMAMGLSVDLMNQFNNRYEINNNAEERLDEYYDNIASALLTYEPSDKFKFRVDYTNYWLDYDERANRFRNRMDNSVSVYAFYQVRPKTSMFVEYAFADIEYDENDRFDSQEDRYFLGLDWAITADSRGRIKLGYMEKEFDDSELGEEDGFSAELQMQHRFNPKRHATLTAYHRYTESSIETAFAVLSTGSNFSLMQRFTPKWSSTMNLLYYRDAYQGDFTIDGVTREREDDTFRIGPSLIFEPRDWMAVSLGYYYSERGSNFEIFDSENHTVSLSIELTL